MMNPIPAVMISIIAAFIAGAIATWLHPEDTDLHLSVWVSAYMGTLALTMLLPERDGSIQRLVTKLDNSQRRCEGCP